MAHRAATDEICVTGGMGNAPSSKRRGLVRVSACCLLAPKDLACHVCREPHITRGERCSLFTCGSQNKQGKRIVTRVLSQSLCKIRFYNRTMLISIDETCSYFENGRKKTAETLCGCGYLISFVCSPSCKERIYLGSYAIFTRKCPKVSDQDVETAFRIWYTIHEDVKASIYNDWR